MQDNQTTGKTGEQIAEDFLRKKGYTILARNFKIQHPKGPWRGEIDIIAKKKGIIHFIEVKSSKIGFIISAFSPETKVGAGKRRRLVQTSQTWLSLNKIPQNAKWQIDIVSVRGESPNDIRVFENITFG